MIIPYTVKIRITKLTSYDSLYITVQCAIEGISKFAKEMVTYQPFLLISAILGVKVMPFLRSLSILVVLLTIKTFLIVFFALLIL